MIVKNPKNPVAIPAVTLLNLNELSSIEPPLPEPLLSPLPPSMNVVSTPNQAKVTIEAANMRVDQMSRTMGSDKRMARTLSVLK